jgi:uncharacterized protein YjbI with pentapeptide repeats
MKIIKPDHLSLLPTTYAVAGEQRLVLSLFACFPLSGSQAALKAGQNGPGLVEEAEMWTALASILGHGEVFDAGRPKPRAEFLVYGDCLPPKAVEACPVRVRVGRVAKELMVFGDRSRDAGLQGAPGRPQPFERMPLTWENAYGGPDHPANPLGKGYGADQSGCRPVPNLILASEHPLPPDRNPSPTSLRAVPSWWPQRTRYLGPFDRQWLADGARDLPAATNPLVHMSASPDQWLDGFFIGDEDFELINLHPSRPGITGILPGLRARVFVTGPGQGLDTFREISTRADTVWFFPEQELGVVCYRAVVPVQDEDGDDVGHVLLGHEPLAAAPLPAAHYLELLRQELFPLDEEAAVSRDEPQDEPQRDSHDGQSLAAEGTDSPGSDHSASPPEPDPGLVEFQAGMERIQAESREMLAKMGYTEEQVRELVQKYEAQATEMAETLPDKSLEELAADAQNQAQAQAEAFLARHGQTQEQALEALQSRQPQPPTLEDIDAMLAQGRITPEIAGHIRQAHAALAAFLALSATMANGKTPEPDTEDGPVPEQPSGQVSELGAPRDAIGPDLTGQDLSGQDLSGQNLSGQDFSGQDFTGQNLAGRDFSGTVLERAVFAGVDLTKTVFTGAVLTEAVFIGARCSGAVFTRADAWKADFQDADLSGADLSEADFSGGNFVGADLTDAVGTRTGFDTARMTGLKAARGRFQGAEFSRADLSGAVLEQTDLTDADFDQALLRGANLTRAEAVNARFGEADLTGAVLTGANLRESRADGETSFRDCDLGGVRADEAQWSGADLTGANLERASLNGADLSRARLSQTVLTRALAKNADFSKAVLDRAELRLVNLMEASFALASLREARLDRANCFAADLRKAVLSGASLDKANLKRTSLDLEMLDAIERN